MSKGGEQESKWGWLLPGDIFPEFSDDWTWQDILLTLLYSIAASAGIVIVVLVGMMLSMSGPFTCDFPGNPLQRTSLAETMGAFDSSYSMATDFVQFSYGLEDMALGKCFAACGEKTCFAPLLGDSQNCRVECVSFGMCLKQCERCDAPVAMNSDFTCITAEHCASFGFK